MQYTGIAGRKARGESLSFFTPYDTFDDFLNRSLTVFLAPLSFSILALEALFYGLFYLSKALVVDVLTWNTEQMLYDAVMGFGAFPLLFTVCLLGVALSPLMNLVDVLGSFVTTAIHSKDEQPFEESNLFEHHQMH